MGSLVSLSLSLSLSLFALGSSLMFWVTVCSYKGYKSSLRDSIYIWSSRGKICHIERD